MIPGKGARGRRAESARSNRCSFITTRRSCDQEVQMWQRLEVEERPACGGLQSCSSRYPRWRPSTRPSTPTPGSSQVPPAQEGVQEVRHPLLLLAPGSRGHRRRRPRAPSAEPLLLLRRDDADSHAGRRRLPLRRPAGIRPQRPLLRPPAGRQGGNLRRGEVVGISGPSPVSP